MDQNSAYQEYKPTAPQFHIPSNTMSGSNTELRLMYISCADHDILQASGNIPYAKRGEQIREMAAEIGGLRAQLASSKCVICYKSLTYAECCFYNQGALQ